MRRRPTWTRRAPVLAALAFAGSLATAAELGAQPYDVPAFLTPYGENGFGLFFVLQDFDDPGVVGTGRWAGTAIDVGARAGFLDSDGDLALLGGVDLKNELVKAGPGFPLDVAWVSGVGLRWVPNDETGVFRVPLGAALGRRLTPAGSEGRLTLYAYPRLGFDLRFFPEGSGGDRSHFSVGFDIDLGADWEWRDGYMGRFALTLGRDQALGIGLSFW